MNYINAISMALEAAKIRASYFEQKQDIRYLEEMCEWIQVANIYADQLKRFDN